MSTTTKCTVYLLSLTSSIQEFKNALAELPEEQKPLLTTKVIHWIFPPAIPSVDELTATTWDMVVCFKATFSMPSSLSQMIKASWNISFDAPPAVLASLSSTQSELATSVHPRSGELDLLTDSELRENDTVSSVDSAEMTSSLKTWMQSFTQDQESSQKPQAIIMFNLLAFKDMERYKKYQEAFIAGAGTRHGARPLLYGEVVDSSRQRQGYNPWEMTAFVQYPSVLHFADMLCSSDYKEISHKYRKGSLVDNPLLCLAYV